jgi:hypothetical protein
MADSLCCFEKHADSSGRSVFQWSIRKCFSRCCRWNCGGPLPSPKAVDTDDYLHGCAFCGTCPWAFFGGVYQFLRLLVRNICRFTGYFDTDLEHRRWSFYVLLIWAGVILACVLFVPETFHPVLLSRKAAALRKRTGDSQYYSASELARTSKPLSQTLFTSLTVPFKLLFLDPMILALCTYTSLLQGILYLCFGAFPLIFTNNHGFNLWQVSLSFLGLLVGNVIACFCNPLWHKQWMGLIAKEKQRRGSDYKPEPELRLPPAMVGSVLATGGLFWFAWTTYSSVPWIVPILATIPFSVGSVLLDNLQFVITLTFFQQILLCVPRNLDLPCVRISQVCRKRYGC